MNELLSAISVLLVFVIMFNESLSNKYYSLLVNKPNKEKKTEYDKYKKNIEKTRNKYILLSLFILLIISTIVYAQIDTFQKLNPVFVVSILVLISLILLLIIAIQKVFLVSKKF